MYLLCFKVKTRPTRFLALAFSILILAIQTHYFVNFGQLTTSSWGSTNVLNSLIRHGSINEVELFRAKEGNNCLESLPFNALWLPELTSVDVSCYSDDSHLVFSKFLSEGRKVGSLDSWPAYQLNTEERLALKGKIDQLLINVIKEDPTAVIQTIIGSNGSPSNFELSLIPPHQFYFIAGNLRAGAPLNSLVRPIGSVASPILIGFSFSFIFQFFWLCFKRERESVTYLPLVLLFSYSLLFGVLLPRDENQRYLFEMYPLMLLMSMLALNWSNNVFVKSDKKP